MAPDRRLVDQHQVELAQQMCEAAIDVVEQQLSSLTPVWWAPAVRRRRLTVVLSRLYQLKAVIGALAPEDPTAPQG